MGTQTLSSSILIPNAGRPLTDQINIRREAVMDSKHYSILGRMLRLFFDPGGMNPPNYETLDHPVLRNNELNWENDDPRQSPVLAISKNDKSLLIIGKLPPLSELTAADTNDPKDWVKTNLPGWQVPRGGRVAQQGRRKVVVDRIPAGMMPRRYVQRYSDLTLDFIGGGASEPNFHDPDCFFVIQPVVQIFVHMAGLPVPGMVQPRTSADGTKMAFLVNPKTREGHFLGGTILFTTELHTLPEGAKP